MSDRVTEWLEQLGLGEYEPIFAENAIDEEVLPELTDGDLRDLGVKLGHRKKLLKAIAALQPGPTASSPASPDGASVTATSAATKPSEAERRQLTVMFCDLVGSTELSGQLDPEDLREINLAYQDTCKAAIERFEGYVARYMGDGVLAYFGYPRAHEDDAERAVRAGLRVVEAMSAVQTGVGREKDVELAVRIGIATGPVIVGDLIGEGVSQESAAVGETPNLAARLQALAEPGNVVIAATTQRLTGGLFEYTDLGRHELKGFRDSVQIWRVVSEIAGESRFDAIHTAGLTPLVGRDSEIALLLKRWERAKDGEGQVMLFSGEPGIGKSRLTQTLRKRIADEPHAMLRYQCSAHHSSSAFYPFIEQLQRAAGFVPADSSESKLAKLEALLALSSSEVSEIAPLFAALLSIPQTRCPPINLSPQRQREKTIEALTRQVSELSSQAPVLFVLEDAHWADPTTLEVLGELIDAVADAPVLVLITYRPEFDPPWQGGGHVTLHSLTRLGKRQCATMITQMAGGCRLPEEVLEEIVAKTDGVPLFIEELTKAVLEADFLEGKRAGYTSDGLASRLTVPSTLQDLLMARLDKLGPLKEVAQMGAAISREFSYELLAAVSPLDERVLQNALEQLTETGLLYRQGLLRETTYTFKHALVQDAAYESLLRARRLPLHGRIAQALKERHDAETEPELLAHHYTEAGLVEEAVAYWQRAGESANNRAANSEAISHLTRGLEVLGTLVEGRNRMQRELSLRTILGRVITAMKGYGDPQVAEVFGRARELCERMGETPQLFPVLLGLSIYYMVRAEAQTARELGEKLLRLARQSEDPVLLVEAHYSLGVNFFWLGEFAPANEHLQQAIEHYDLGQHHTHLSLYGQDAGAVCLSRAGIALWYLGYPDQARDRMREAVDIAKKLAHPFSLAYVYTWAAWLFHYRREYDESYAWVEATIDFSTDQGFPFWYTQGKVLQGWLITEQGKIEQGIQLMREGMAGVRKVGSEVVESYALALLGRACGKAGQAEEGLALLDEALDKVNASTARWPEAELCRLRGELLLQASGNEAAPRAEACFAAALEVARRQCAKLPELRTAMSLARLWEEQGKRQEAHNLLAPIYNWFTEGFDTTDLKEAQALLAQLT